MVENDRKPIQEDILPRKDDLLSLLKSENSKSAVLLAVIEVTSSGGAPRIWMIRENETKPATNKQKGMYSIPAETAKKGETKLDTLLGAIAELSDDQYFSELARNLFLVDNLSHHEVPEIINGHSADLVIMAYTGKTVPFTPINGEVSPEGWKTAEELAKLDGNVRFTLDALLKLEREEGILTTFIEGFKTNKGIIPLSQVLPEDLEGFSIEEFYYQREKIPDINISGPAQVFPGQ